MHFNLFPVSYHVEAVFWVGCFGHACCCFGCGPGQCHLMFGSRIQPLRSEAPHHGGWRGAGVLGIRHSQLVLGTL